jgi:predicted amidohydrolase YtcJ
MVQQNGRVQIMRTLMHAGLAALAVMASTSGAAAPPSASEAPATLWHGGTIITMDGPTPQTVEAVVERGGKIVFAGAERRARVLAGAGAKVEELGGATMLPGFVDAHSHFALVLQAAGGIDMADPSLFTTRTIPGQLAALKAEAARRDLIGPGKWLIAWQYNDETLAERRHITRAELDALFPDQPVVLLHFTMHGLVANSAALAAAGVDEATRNPEGGVMPKGPDGKLTGLLFEQAMMLMAAKLPQPTVDQKLAALDEAQLRYAREGYTHAQEGATQLPDLKFLLSDAARTRLVLDLAVLPFYSTLDWVLAQNNLQFGTYQGHLKLEGIKFVLDGSPQARTAYSTREYARGAPDGHHPWHGEPSLNAERFHAMAAQVHAKGWQLFVHANGDAAIDMAIAEFDRLGITAKDNRRPIVIHSQFQRPDQLPAYARIGVGPAYFSNHTYYFADTHRSNFPAEVVDFISPFNAARAAGLVVSNHSDAPVTALDTMTQLWSAMARTSITGIVSGVDQRLSAYAALQAMTTGPAWQVFEENRKGRIKAGLLADFVVLDHNPLTTPVDQIRTIKVLRTIKEGRTIWAGRR